MAGHVRRRARFVIGTAVISLPGNLRALAREEGVPLLRRSARSVPGSAACDSAGAVLLAIAWWPAPRLLGRVLLEPCGVPLRSAHADGRAETALGRNARSSAASVARPHSWPVEASREPVAAVMIASPQDGRPIAGPPVSRLRAVRSRLFWSVIWPRIRPFVDRTFHSALLIHTTNFTQTSGSAAYPPERARSLDD